MGLTRTRCRCIRDLAEGWVTVKGNQGTGFLKEASKPFLHCVGSCILQEARESASTEVRTVRPGEVLEVLEGPSREQSTDVYRVPGRASKDGKIGFVTLKGGVKGEVNFELTKLLVCKNSTAITTDFDITEGRSLRKLAVNETLEIIGEPKQDTERSLTRVQAKATKDGKQGWVSMTGNQGTTYLQETEKHYICRRSVPLEKTYQSGGNAVRSLAVGEVFEASDGPKIERKPACDRMKVRLLSDNTVGWFTHAEATAKPWAPRYRCTTSTALSDSVDESSGKALRNL